MERTQDHQWKKEIATAKRICDLFHIDTLKPQIAAIEETIQERNVINVAVLGRFKAGKSSFLNSVIGKEIIPVGVLPLTAAVTRIRHGLNDKATVSFLNGQIEEIGFKELEGFIAEEHNPENVKKVARVDLELSCLKKYPGIQFVDTPGLGSVFRHNTATSKDWLPRVGAAFLTISIDHPLSEDDILLLKELESHTPETHILLTKIDLVSSEEVVRVTEFIKAQIQKKTNKELHLFPFSIKPGFETARSNVYEFIQSVSQSHLQRSKKINGYKLSSLASQCLGYLQLATAAAASTEESRRFLRNQLRQERENLPAIQNEIEAIVTNIKTRLRTESYEKFQAQLPWLRPRLIAGLTEAMPLWKGNLDKAWDAFWDWLRTSLTKELEDLSSELGEQVTSSYVNEVSSSFFRIARAFQDRLANEIEKALRVRFDGVNFEAQIEKPKEPDIHLYEFSMNSLMTSFRVFIPVRWVRPLLKRRLISQIQTEVEKNLSRLSFQWVDAISLCIDGMAGETLEFIRNEIAAVENLLAGSVDRRADIEKSICELKPVASRRIST